MTTSMTESQARDEICRIGKSLFDRGYVHATAGNISVRLDEGAGGGLLITPTDACLGFLDPAKLSLLSADGQHVSGDKPSKTSTLHRRIYQTVATIDEVRCIIHTHSSYCVQISLEQPAEFGAVTGYMELLPPITPYFVMKVGNVPLIPYQRPGSLQTVDLVEKAIRKYGEKSIVLRAVMLERLGPNVWHSSAAHAMAALEELEETAKLYYRRNGHVEPLNRSQLEELKKAQI